MGPDGRRKSFYASTEAEAIAKAQGSFGIQQDKTLYGFYAAVYCPTVLQRSTSWRSQIAWAMDKYILPEFGDRDMQTLTRPELQRFFNKLGAKMQPSTLKGVKIIFSGVLNLAESDEQIPKNPLRHVRLPVPQPSKKTALAPDELAALLKACPLRIRPYVLLTGFCGLRAGEALGVTRSAIRNGVLSVGQQVLQPKGGCKISDRLKTPQSRRDIPLPAEMLEQILKSEQVSAVFVCSDEKGGFLTPNNAHRDLEEAIKAAGIRRVTPHELRHTFISILENDLECPPAIVASLAGKTYQGNTARYNHVTPKQLARWMEKYWELTSTGVTTFACRQA